MGRITKFVVAVTGLLVAIGTLIGTISMNLGRSSPPEGVTIILNSPEAYAEFLADHPAG
tara:strand:+ start:806 stop:982 length:177 start_codon:yes stop_codon:yes gene_type:complete